MPRHEPVQDWHLRLHTSELNIAPDTILRTDGDRTLHNGHSTMQLGYYLDEFTFGFNRRNSRKRGLLWFRLVEQAVNTDPYPNSEIAAAGANHR